MQIAHASAGCNRFDAFVLGGIGDPGEGGAFCVAADLDLQALRLGEAATLEAGAEARLPPMELETQSAQIDDGD